MSTACWTITNFLGDAGRDPRKIWIYKAKENGKPATNIHQYVDDGRITGETEEDAWEGSSKMAKTCSEKGVQDATRKRREANQKPGGWA